MSQPKKRRPFEEAVAALRQGGRPGLVFLLDESIELQVCNPPGTPTSVVLRQAQVAIGIALRDARKREASMVKRTLPSELTGWAPKKETDYDN